MKAVVYKTISNLITVGALIGTMFRRRMFRARRRGGRRFGRKRAKPTINHYESVITTTTGGTEQGNTVVLGIDDVANRSSHVPDGAVLTKCSVRLQCDSLQNGQYKAMLYHSPGGLGIGTPLASWYSTTDPLPEDSILIRKYKLTGPFVRQQITESSFPMTFNLRWRGRMRWRDGDDLILQTNFPNTGQTSNLQATLVYYGG